MCPGMVEWFLFKFNKGSRNLSWFLNRRNVRTRFKNLEVEW